MAKLIIKKDGSIDIERWVYSGKGEGKYVTSFLPLDHILSYLDSEFELEESFTLRDYFTLILNYSALQKLDLNFPLYIKEFLLAPKSGCINNEMSEIILEFNVASILSSGHIEGSLEVYINVSGISNKEDGIRFGLDFCPLDKILDLPIVFGDALVYKTKDYIKIQDQQTENFSYTLYNFIHGIIYELSFYGSPENRDKEGEELEEGEGDVVKVVV